MSTTINTIKETGKVHALPPKVPISRVKAISGDNIFAIGGVTQKNIQVTCTITRYFRDLKDGLTAWTRTLFCLADDTGIWTANIGGLTEGIYVLAFGAEGEDIDCAVIEVPAKKITRPFTAITDTSALPASITVKGTVLYYPQTVNCTLCPVTDQGVSNPPSSSKSVYTTNGFWSVSFVPHDLNATSTPFNGLYSFVATAYEGTASEPISV